MSASPPSWLAVDHFVAAYEAARAAGDADLAAFLPPPDHPLYTTVLRELVCVDLELTAATPSPRRLEDYRERFPALFADSAALAALAYQDYRLRADAGDPVLALEYHRRWGVDVVDWPTRPSPPPSPPAPRAGWRHQVDALYQDYRDAGPWPENFVGSLEHADFVVQMNLQPGDSPLVVGSEWCGFVLKAELGRGTFGRVFLSEQRGLANRLVVLKVGTTLFHESQALALLQHTNIVPIHSAHRYDGLQGLCMPYFGSATLADVLTVLRRHGTTPLRSNALWSTLHDRHTTVSPPTPTPPAPIPQAPLDSPALTALRSLDHVHAVLWLAVRLADGLAHAHERGIVHRDLKPANILLADDGQPMLLDFNLAEDVRLRSGVPALLGGTLPYMAPEHLEAFQGGSCKVDARSDTYSLGLILYELLAGVPPYVVPTDGTLRDQVPRLLEQRLREAPPLRSRLAGVTPAIEAIVRKCLHPDPEQRYQSARQLQEDAQRQLDDLPLKHAADRSPVERASKFLRRHPRVPWALGAAVLTILLIAAIVGMQQRGRQAARAESARVRQVFHEDHGRARLLLGLLHPGNEELQEGQRLCRKALGHFGLPDNDAWDRTAPFTLIARDAQSAIRRDASELLLLLARAVRLRDGAASAESLRYNDRAGEVAGSHERVRLLQRALFLARDNQREQADDLRQRALALPLEGAWQRHLEANVLLGEGKLAEAMALFQEASRLDPGNAATWAALSEGHRLYRQPARAAAALTAYLALRPGDWRGKLWRAQARLELSDRSGAKEDVEDVLTERPDLAPAHLLNALVLLGGKQYREAIKALDRWHELAPDQTRYYFLRAEAWAALGQSTRATADLNEGARLAPVDEQSALARARTWLQRNDARAALADLELALRFNPWSRDALQDKAHVLSDHLNRAADAVAALDRLLGVYPDDVKALAGRAVLHARLGDRDAALRDARSALAIDPAPLILYQAACVHALNSRVGRDERAEAFRLLRQALRGGFGAEYLEADPDLQPLRDKEEFKQLLALARGLLGKR